MTFEELRLNWILGKREKIACRVRGISKRTWAVYKKKVKVYKHDLIHRSHLDIVGQEVT
jgi:hypothetical protein